MEIPVIGIFGRLAHGQCSVYAIVVQRIGMNPHKDGSAALVGYLRPLRIA